VGVTFVPGSGLLADGGGDDSARLSVSFPSVADIRIGADRLVATARSQLISLGAA
jgi:DNA-binding transcriptional MocR family regulator